MSTLTHTIQFSKTVYWTSGAGILGVKFINSTTAEAATVNSVTELTGTSNILTYSVTWLTDPVDGDVIVFDYAATPGGAGVYTDSEDNPMEDQTLQIANCTDDPGSTDAVIQTGGDGYIIQTSGDGFILEV